MCKFSDLQLSGREKVPYLDSKCYLDTGADPDRPEAVEICCLSECMYLIIQNPDSRASIVDPWHCAFGTYESRSGDPYHRLADSDLAPRMLLFRQWLTKCRQKLIFLLTDGRIRIHIHNARSFRNCSYGCGSVTLQFLQWIGYQLILSFCIF